MDLPKQFVHTFDFVDQWKIGLYSYASHEVDIVNLLCIPTVEILKLDGEIKISISALFSLQNLCASELDCYVSMNPNC